MRIPRLKAPYVVVLFAAIAFPLIWWGPPLLVAFGAALGLAALFWIATASPPTQGAPDSEPASADAPAPPASTDLGNATGTHRTTASIAAVAIALMALVSGIDDPVLSVKIALSSLLVSRALLALLPSQLEGLARMAIAHAGALVATTLMLEPSGVLTSALWQAVWLAVDFSRVHFVTAPQANADAAATTNADVRTVAQPNATPLVSGETDGGDAPGQAASSDPLPAPANDTQPEASSAGSAETAPQTQTQTPLARKLARSAGAVAAALTIIALISLGFVETVAPPTQQQAADASLEPEFDWLWGQAPWRDREPTPEAPRTPAPIYGSHAWACAQTPTLEARGLHTLTAQARAAPGDDADDDWAPAVLDFDTPPLTASSQQVANRAFGAPCPDAENTRVIDGARLRAATGYRHQENSTGLIVVGAVHALDLPDGRRLLLARGWSNDGEPAPSHLLMSWATTNDEDETPTIWIVSSKGSMGVAGVLFAPADQPLGGYHLWYGAMGADGALSASSADIIDVSGSAPRNTGAIPIWGASRCGQVPGDLLEAAEPNCVEEPAWAFWLTDFAYAPAGADEVMLTWRVRRQVGAAGEPATYEEAYESNMRGRFVLSGGRWRFMDGEGALIADAGFELALNETRSQE